MQIHVVVEDRTVSIDGEGYRCATLSPPEDWAHAYHWIDDAGRIEPIWNLGRDAEHFTDIARMQFAIDAHAQAKREAADAERKEDLRNRRIGQPPPQPSQGAEPDQNPEPRSQKRNTR